MAILAGRRPAASATSRWPRAKNSSVHVATAGVAGLANWCGGRSRCRVRFASASAHPSERYGRRPPSLRRASHGRSRCRSHHRIAVDHRLPTCSSTAPWKPHPQPRLSTGRTRDGAGAGRGPSMRYAEAPMLGALGIPRCGRPELLSMQHHSAHNGRTWFADYPRRRRFGT